MLNVQRPADEVVATTSAVAVAAWGACDTTNWQVVRDIEAGLSDGKVVPYLGPGVLTLAKQDWRPLEPTSAGVAGRGNRQIFAEACGEESYRDVPPTALHSYLASLRTLPLIIHDWYDDLPRQALAFRGRRGAWGMVQGTSRAGHYGLRYLQADETSICATAPDAAKTWATLLYQPLGSVTARSQGDSIKIEDMIDHKVPIPKVVQSLAEGRHFLFLGCRFSNESDRMFARRILHRSSVIHWAVLPEPPTVSEARFLTEQNIERVDIPLSSFVATLMELRRQEKAQLLLASW